MNIFSLTVNGQGFIGKYIIDAKRDEFFREMIRPWLLAVAQFHQQFIGMVKARTR